MCLCASSATFFNCHSSKLPVFIASIKADPFHILITSRIFHSSFSFFSSIFFFAHPYIILLRIFALGPTPENQLCFHNHRRILSIYSDAIYGYVYVSFFLPFQGKNYVNTMDNIRKSYWDSQFTRTEQILNITSHFAFHFSNTIKRRTTILRAFDFNGISMAWWKTRCHAKMPSKMAMKKRETGIMALWFYYNGKNLPNVLPQVMAMTGVSAMSFSFFGKLCTFDTDDARGENGEKDLSHSKIPSFRIVFLLLISCRYRCVPLSKRMCRPVSTP